MNIAEQVLTLKNDIDDVFKAGKKAGGGGCDIDHTALYNEGYGKGYTEGETVGYNKGYADGQESAGGQENAPNPLEYAKTVLYREVEFPTDYELTLNVPMLNSLNYAFYNTSGIKKATIKGNGNGNAIDFSNAFRNCADIEVLDFTELVVKVGSCNSTFHTARKLREILGEFDFAECINTNTMFQNCNALEEVRVKANSLKLSISFSASSLLSANSIQSIIDGLATVETQQILTLHSDISSALTNEQHEQISNKNWRLE